MNSVFNKDHYSHMLVYNLRLNSRLFERDLTQQVFHTKKMLIQTINLLILSSFSNAIIPPADAVFQGRPTVPIPAVELGRGISNWPPNIVAPYIYLSRSDPYKWKNNKAVSGIKHWTLCFLTADGQGNPAWGGWDSIDNPFYSNYIGGIRSDGGDVIISFGGASGITR
jgi:hypothetical protein